MGSLKLVFMRDGCTRSHGVDLSSAIDVGRLGNGTVIEATFCGKEPIIGCSVYCYY